MSFYRAVGYQFSNPSDAQVDGGVILASKIAKPVLDRRVGNIEDSYPHLEDRLLDPQLYLARLDPQAQKPCMKLASYPWFNVDELDEYDSQQLTQSEWKDQAESSIGNLWPGQEPQGNSTVTRCVQRCIDYQIEIGCEAIILPAPLTTNSAGYSDELNWIDKGIEYARGLECDLPVYATVAIQDICLKYESPPKNQLISTIADTVSAREVDGVYLVLEQSSEPQRKSHCESSRTLWSILSLVHQFAIDADLKVGVNFLGVFGQACRAAGADFWSSGWYKSLYRLRMADMRSDGRAYPKYWSFPGAVDVHLRDDFDALAGANLIGNAPLDDQTPASEGLLQAASEGKSVSDVAAWVYRQSNVSEARNHFYLSVLNEEDKIRGETLADQRQEIEDWLEGAEELTSEISRVLPPDMKTNIDHVRAWHEAFRSYRNQYGL